ncbi:predicted protein [Nematostella vectensis]|uniref:Trifunctional purine biosynthetic protein adenosine-3 n=1 Tax=Nematostella vectensis TaxID=45351 RepID=A7SD96_NEMVE|nr:predicted protein [Nematostella vectensis]|eukprot:XP_001630409.1 predicted protein [Nematostella vectensis]
MGDKVLLIGSGGREHAIAWKLSQSDHVSTIYIAPGNAGTEGHKMQNVSSSVLDVNVNENVVSYCRDNKVDFVVVGPEAPLANGIADSLQDAGIPCFGPSQKAAQIEASKDFAKHFMSRHDIPTAKFASFTDADKACEHIRKADYAALVVKASGLAAGKGVVVASDKDEAIRAVHDMLKDNIFGDAGSTIVIEEKLEGEEFSVLAFTDGKTIAAMPPAQDHKTLLDGDKGPNTGGMGAYAPCPQISDDVLETIKRDVLQRAVDGMREEGCPYIGVLYAGIMLTSDGPKVLEFNCRFGDPETQVLLPLLKSDLYATMMECVTGELEMSMPVFAADKVAVGVVMASGGYPGSYKKGLTIHGLEGVMSLEDTLVFHAGTKPNESRDQVVTSGGRVLAVVGLSETVVLAQEKAYEGVKGICFDDCYYRKDIASKACRSAPLSYFASGVNIDAGNSLVKAIKPLAAATARSGCSADLGGFGGFFDLAAAGYKDPLLVSGTDGVGTKLKVAQSVCCHGSVGIDLVAMCVNDILAHGAEPLYFLDYFACGKLDVGVAKEVVRGVAEGCSQAGCALIGGETAEMPGMYQNGEYDIAGFAVGAVEREQVLPRIQAIKTGDVLIGLASSGIHSNGFSLVRRVIEAAGLEFSCPAPFPTTQGVQSMTSLGMALLAPTRIYCKAVLPLMKGEGCKIKAFAHITGGGLVENIPRILPDGKGVELDANTWKIQPVFGWIWSQGQVATTEMVRTFNCGIGGVLIVEGSDAAFVLDSLRDAGETVWSIGQVIDFQDGIERVKINNIHHALENASADALSSWQEGRPFKFPISLLHRPRMRVGVLISGSGTNLQALIDRSLRHDSHADIVLVISNKPGVQGLKRAQDAGIPTMVIKHKDFKNRVDFDMAVHAALEDAQVELVCLAGFMRILSGDFVRKWRGRLLNIHPSLLPSFKGIDAHQQVLAAGVCISGCTVHFVVEEVDAGAIITQEVVPVLPGDTVQSLQERVKTAEHRAYPRALELLASGKARLDVNGKVELTA